MKLNKKLQLAYDGCANLFINKGFERTQMRDIPKATGLSTGTLYSMFTGKPAIMSFVLKCTIDPEYMEQKFELPISEDLFTGLEDEIKQALDEINGQFAAHLVDAAQGYSFEEMLGDAFDVISRYGVGCLIMEHNTESCGSLGAYYLEYRRRFMEQFNQYVDIFVNRGEVRTLEHPRYSVRLMIETLSWWGMHVNHDAFQMDEQVPASIAKKVCLEGLLNGYRQ